MNIVFYGASVTQQTNISGYVPTFETILLKNNYNYNIIQKGFGSMHLSDAGITCIDKIINENPQFCFIDWFSTGFITTDQIYLFTLLDTIVRKLMLHNCKICFLLLDRIDMCENRLIMYKNIVNYAEIYNIQYIEIYNNNNKCELLRDDVHTNEAGANFYSNKIYNYFIKNLMNDTRIYNKIPDENEYSHIKSIKIDKKINKEISINGKFKIVGIHQQLSEFSGLIEITRNNIEKYNVMIWDQWCHFMRDSIKVSIDWSENVVIKILQDIFDTTSCKKDINFNNIEKYMYIHEIFYLGELYEYQII